MEEKKVNTPSVVDAISNTKPLSGGAVSKPVAEVLSIPFLDKIGAFLTKVQAGVNAVDWRKMNAAFAGVSFLADTLLNVQESNNIRSEKYPTLASNLADAAACSWFLSLIVDFRSYERLGFCVDGVSDPEQRRILIEENFSNYYRDNMDWLGQIIVVSIPDRAFAISPAMNAHLRGEYALSIPVFLSQAEGILRDMTSTELFTKSQNISGFAQAKRTAIKLDDTWLSFSDDSFWAQLSGDLPIGWGARQRADNNYTGINRNTALHGIDKGYATEINSLKTFSLLCHITGLLSALEDEKEAVESEIL
jgi:hypothetical protein